MRVFTELNTNRLMPVVYDALNTCGYEEDSRNGKVLKFDTPITLVYTEPWCRVNLCEVRDANPFFHLMEGLAMLAPLNSVEFLSRFNSNIGNYSDDGRRFNAFYGSRLRIDWGDQLSDIINLLKIDPTSRQLVAQIWNPRDLGKETRDKACNMILVFKYRRDCRLDMTCYNRSNDLIWGSVSGANVVHFSMIHEYVATSAGLAMGRYYQVANDAHVYLDNPLWGKLQDKYTHSPVWFGTDYDALNTVPLIKDPAEFGYELEKFFGFVMRHPKELLNLGAFDEPFLRDVAVPMYNAWVDRKYHNAPTECDMWIDAIKADDWRLACKGWVNRRV